MRLRISHETNYEYNHPVFCEPLVIRLIPRGDAMQRVLEFELAVSPEPAGKSQVLDAHGNAVVQAWFSGVTDRLTIRTTAVVETLRQNPFDFLLDVQRAALPVTYSGEELPPLEVYRGMPQGVHPEVAAFAAALVTESDGQLLPFLNRLNDRIHSRSERLVRETGDPWPAVETLRHERGACRDLAWLFIEACRTQGIAARFVSGYELGDTAIVENELHAWAEAYVPNAGWRGYDPTLGLAVADRHVALAAAHVPLPAAPVAGSFRGADAESRLTTRLSVEIADPVSVQSQSQSF